MSAQVHRNALPSGYKLLWYRMEKVLGQGGFGITYLAWDGNLKIWVAIKEYLPIDLAVRAADRPQTVAAWKALFPSLVADGWLPTKVARDWRRARHTSGGGLCSGLYISVVARIASRIGVATVGTGRTGH